MQSRKYFLRAFFFVFLLTCLLTGLVGTVRIQPVRAISSNIVISQVYGGGGNTGATYASDYVELFNLNTSAPASLNGWSIQYASATGTTWSVVNLSGSLLAGQYYLVQLTSAGATGSVLPTPDVIAPTNVNMSATVGKVALVNTTTALSGGCPTTGIVDFVGYGTTADCREGGLTTASNAPAPSNTTADIRATNGCTDTDNNSTDFAAGAPTPRNTNSMGLICGVGTYTATSTPTNTLTPTNTNTPTNTATPSNTPIFSLTPSLTPTPGEVIISEVAWMGTAASVNDEWIELYNTRSTPIDLTGWRLTNFTGSVDIVINVTSPAINNGVIPANGFFLLERAHELTVSDVTANQIYTGALADTNDNLTLSKPDGTVSDTANKNGGAWPAGTGSPNFYSMERVVVGGVPMADIDAGWVSSTNSALWTKHDAAGNLIHGTPAGNNWGFTVTATGTPTASATPTRTLTPTRTPTGLAPAKGVVISELRTTGPSGGSDEFIELYNPTISSVLIGNWLIKKSGGCNNTTPPSLIVTISAGITLASGQHYLIGGSKYSGTVTANQTATLGIADNGGIALFNSSSATTPVDAVGLCSTTTYHEGTALTPLTTYTNRSYSRKASLSGVCADTNNNYVDFFLRNPSDPQNLASALTLCGNPTATPTKTAVPTKFRTSTPAPPPPPQLLGINEFVPRPGHDWNNDGQINTGDEYIELINFGVVNVSLSGYRLDDEANVGSTPFGLPAVTLKPGERRVFYESQTNIHLDDGGDGVRLIKPNGQLADAYNYSVVKYPDQSYCRLPDNGGLDDWNQNCAPTPGLRNAPRNGSENLPIVNGDDNSCPVGDTLPLDFWMAECEPFGNNIWSRLYWDAKGWLGEKVLPNTNGQWDVYGD